jgi:type IX secretion system PorP/SprF family membrane protein
MRKLFSVIIIQLGIIIGSINAQQEAHYTQFMYNKALQNPAFVGARRVNSLTALYRNQWIGFKGHPDSYLLSFDGPVLSERTGLGVILAKQELGITQNLFGQLAISYGILQVNDMSLRIGINTAVRSYKFDLNNPDVYIKDRQDASLKIGLADTKNQMYFNLGTGLYFDYKNFYFGVSIPNLNKNLINLGQNPLVNYPAQEQRHIYAMTGGLLKLTEGIEFKPAIMFKFVKNAPFSLDANMNLLFNRKFGVGASFRYGQTGGDSADLLTFFQATDRVSLGLAYDITLSGLKSYNSGSIEALVRYDFAPSQSKAGKNKQDRNRLSNPRYFF